MPALDVMYLEGIAADDRYRGPQQCFFDVATLLDIERLPDTVGSFGEGYKPDRLVECLSLHSSAVAALPAPTIVERIFRVAFGVSQQDLSALVGVGFFPRQLIDETQTAEIVGELLVFQSGRYLVIHSRGRLVRPRGTMPEPLFGSQQGSVSGAEIIGETIRPRCAADERVR